jgi:hypothetical protein
MVSGCHQGRNSPDTDEPSLATTKSAIVDKPFVSGGKIEMQLDGGAYEVVAAADNHIRVRLTGNAGAAKTEVTASETSAKVDVSNTPKNFRATIEVPATTDLVAHLKGGVLALAPITGNKEVQSYGGEITIGVADPDQYSTVDATVKVGEIDAGAFGGSKSGMLQRFTWSGPGKYTLHADLGAGSLALKKK